MCVAEIIHPIPCRGVIGKNTLILGTRLLTDLMIPKQELEVFKILYR